MKRLPLLLLLIAQAFGQATTNGSVSTPNINDTSTGTVLHELATPNSLRTGWVTTTTSQTTPPMFIVTAGAGTGGPVNLANSGIAACIFDQTLTAVIGAFVVNSTITNGYCHAQTSAPAAGVWVVGTLRDANVASGPTTPGLVIVSGYNYGSASAGCGTGTAGNFMEFASGGTTCQNAPVVDNGTAGITATSPATGQIQLDTSPSATTGAQLVLNGASNADVYTFLGAVPYSVWTTTTGPSSGCTWGGSPPQAQQCIVRDSSGDFSELFLHPNNPSGPSGSNSWQLTDQSQNIIQGYPYGTVGGGLAGVQTRVGSGFNITNYANGVLITQVNSGGLTIDSGSLAISALTGTTCLHQVSGVVGTTAADCLSNWASIPSGVNTNVLQMGTGGQLTYTGTGQVNANYLQGYALPPFTTGNICFTGGVLSICPAGIGTVTSVVIAGTSGQITATGTCTITSSGTCTLAFPTTITPTNVTISGTLNIYGQNFPATAPGSTQCLQNTGAAWIFGSCGSGSGSVTNVTVGNLSPLFTSSVATSSTTPAITFALSNVAADLIYGNPTGGSTTPTFFGVSSPLAFASSLLGCATCATSAASLVAHLPVVGEGSQTTATIASAGTSGQALLSAGSSTDPAYGALNLGGTSTITGTLPSANLPAIFQTNSVTNTTATSLNAETSTTNALGIAITPVNSATNVEKWEASGNFTGAEPLIGNGTGALISSPSIYLSGELGLLSGGDYGALINSVWTTMAPGSTVHWDLPPGKYLSKTNPWAGVSFSSTIPGTLIFDTPVSIYQQGSTGWIQPPKVTVIGLGETKTSQDGNQGTGIVGCWSASIGPCTSTFAIDTPLYALISNLPNANYSGAGTTTRASGLTIDCSYIQGCRSAMNYYGQENAGYSNISARNCGNNGVCFDLGNATGAGSNGDSDNGRNDGLNLGNNTPVSGVTAACTYGSVIIRENYPSAGSPLPKSLKDITASNNTCAGLTPPIYPNYNIELNGASQEIEGKVHTEFNGYRAIQFGTDTLLGSGSVNSSGVMTYVSGDEWPTGCTGSFYVSNVLYGISNCTTAGQVTLSGWPGTTVTNVPYSIDTHVGADNIKVETAEECCSVFGTGTASSGSGNCVFTETSGAVPQSFWTGHVILGSTDYTISSVNQSAGTITTTAATCTGSPTTYVYGAQIGFDGSSTIQSDSVTNFKNLSVSSRQPPMMVMDDYNSIIPTQTASSMVAYALDRNHLVIADDSGVNPINITGGAIVTGSGTGQIFFGGSATTPTLIANNVGLFGPNGATFTDYGYRFSQTGPSAAGVLLVGAPSGSISSLTAGLVPLADLATMAANSLVGNNTSGSSSPGAMALPTTGTNGCAGSSNALQYNTSSGQFLCNTTEAQTIANGTFALSGSVGSGLCVLFTATATGAASTDTVSWSANADISGVTGFTPSSSGNLSIYPAYATTNTANIKVCNPTTGSITMGSVTLNWRIAR